MTTPATTPFRLRYASLSPFSRKVLVVAHETGTIGQLALVPADVWTPDSDIKDDNPLGKVPALVTPDGLVVGSTLICQYLDELGDHPILLPAEIGARWAVLRAHALAEGIMEAAVSHVVERIRRPDDRQWPGWLQRQRGKIDGALDHLATLPQPDTSVANLYTVTLACALAYLDRRLPDYPWRANQPMLAGWLDAFALRDSMIATRPPPA